MPETCDYLENWFIADIQQLNGHQKCSRKSFGSVEWGMKQVASSITNSDEKVDVFFSKLLQSGKCTQLIYDAFRQHFHEEGLVTKDKDILLGFENVSPDKKEMDFYTNYVGCINNNSLSHTGSNITFVIEDMKTILESLSNITLTNTRHSDMVTKLIAAIQDSIGEMDEILTNIHNIETELEINACLYLE